MLPTNLTGGTWVDVDNTGALIGNIFNPSQVGSIGVYNLSYITTNTACPGVFRVNMTVNDDCLVLPCQAINIYNAVSPNNDSVNNIFLIENIENKLCYPTNNVEIYNRWGVLVYETQDYDNALKAFKGISEGRTTINKSVELPTGSYFYKIDYTTIEGTSLTKTGYLYLVRKF